MPMNDARLGKLAMARGTAGVVTQPDRNTSSEPLCARTRISHSATARARARVATSTHTQPSINHAPVDVAYHLVDTSQPSPPPSPPPLTVCRTPRGALRPPHGSLRTPHAARDTPVPTSHDARRMPRATHRTPLRMTVHTSHAAHRMPVPHTAHRTPRAACQLRTQPPT